MQVYENFNDLVDVLEQKELQVVKLQLGDWFTIGKLILDMIEDTYAFKCIVQTKDGENYTFHPSNINWIVEQRFQAMLIDVCEIWELA